MAQLLGDVGNGGRRVSCLSRMTEDDILRRRSLQLTDKAHDLLDQGLYEEVLEISKQLRELRYTAAANSEFVLRRPIASRRCPSHRVRGRTPGEAQCHGEPERCDATCSSTSWPESPLLCQGIVGGSGRAQLLPFRLARARTGVVCRL